KQHTYESEEMLFRLYLKPVLGALPVKDISAFHIQKVKKRITDKGKSTRTQQYALQVCRQALNLAESLELVSGPSPMKSIKIPKPDNMKLRYLSVEQAETLLKALEVRSKPMAAMSLLSLHCGLRWAECATLTWDCINWQAGTLAILNAKAGSRTAYLTDRAKAKLTELFNDAGPDAEGLIFPHKSGNGSRTWVSKTFNRVVDELGFNRGVVDNKQRVTFHTLRHTFATHLYKETRDIYLVQRSLGHATLAMTMRYVKSLDEPLAQGAKALGRAFERHNTTTLPQVVELT
ncbi:MAG: tyrosine-type recombinase/integrase, partial [Desulfatibacillaceae bacterium]|nr:tyrosine-type recombinase/integrase [Desulfatibacillaceae bacterium]